MAPSAAGDSVQGRHLEAPEELVSPAFLERWAVVVGISRYRHERLNLKYAHRDAMELDELLRKPIGGLFEKDHVLTLIDEQATTAAITRALRSFLKRPGKDDLVLLYFACHGAPDPDRPHVLYLLTHDTDPADIAATALPMREIDLALREVLLARRVVLLADTCHSAALAPGSRGPKSDDRSGAVNRYLREVSAAKPGVALLTSAEASQVALEGEEWGGGHGVFTHYLLEGMRGKADDPPDGIVSVGELFEYVRDNVRKATNHRQHPSIGTSPFDRRLPLAVTGELSARAHHECGRQLARLGRRLGDDWLLRSAIDYLREARRQARLNGTDLPEASLELGLVRLAIGQYAEAVESLTEVARRTDHEIWAEAAYHLGMASARQGDTEQARELLDSFRQRRPDDGRAKWVGKLLESLANLGGGRRLALLIGVGHPGKIARQLRGPVNDVHIVRGLLTRKMGLPEANVTVLLDEDATREGVLTALRKLQETRWEDVVFVYFSGMGGDAGPSWLVVHDSEPTPTGVGGAIEGGELHDLLEAIPAGRKTAVFDTSPNSTYLNHVQHGTSYSVFLAASAGEQASERVVDEEGTEVAVGAFTHALVSEARRGGAAQSCGVLLERVRRALAGPNTLRKQTPLLFGDEDQAFLSLSGVDFIRLFEFSLRGSHRTLSAEQVERFHRGVQLWLGAPFPDLGCSLARAFLEKHSPAQAVTVLEPVTTSSPREEAERLLLLGTAQARAGRYGDAAATFRRLLEVNEPIPPADPVRAVLTRCERLRQGRRHALLAGVGTYQGRQLPGVPGVANDVCALHEVLVKRHGFLPENVMVLLDGAATRSTLIDSFRNLAVRAREEPALFYFSGNGSIDADGRPTILAWDGRCSEAFDDIELSELGSLVGDEPSNLVTILDAGWNLQSERFVRTDCRPPPALRHLTTDVYPAEDEPRDLRAPTWKLGRLSLYQGSIQYRASRRWLAAEGAFPGLVGSDSETVHGRMSYALIRALDEVASAGLTYADWLSAAARLTDSPPVVIGEATQEEVFSNPAGGQALDRLLLQAERAPIAAAIPVLRQMVSQPGGNKAQRFLDLGIAYAALGNHDKSIEALESALNEEGAGDFLEARYRLGQVLLASNRDINRAVSELDRVAQGSGKAEAYYYLGQALRALAERQIEVGARNAFRKYLDAGAPLGQKNEVLKFLELPR
jgi:tetratricopeptide (TPR) repeat protein